MGKGEIIDHEGVGKYSVKLIYAGRDRVAARIDKLDVKLLSLSEQIAEVQKLIEDLIRELEAQKDAESDIALKLLTLTQRLAEIEALLSSGDYLTIPVKPVDRHDKDDDKDDDNKDPEKPEPDPTEPQPDPTEPNEDDPPPLDGDNTIEGTVTDS